MEPKIVSAGYVSLDITPSFAEQKGRSLKDILRPGQLVEVGKANFSGGGSVTNTGLAMQFFGADTTLIAKVGDDQFGDILRGEYRKRGVEPSFLVSKEDETSYTIAIAVPGSDRVFLADAGANDTLTADEIDETSFMDAQIFHFGYPTLMRQFYQNGGQECVKLYKKIKKAGIITSLDTAMVDPQSLAGAQDWHQIFTDLLPHVDLFLPSFEEICALIWPEKYAQLMEKADGDDVCLHLSLHEDVEPLAERIMAYGCRMVMLKCGAAGLYLKTSTEDVMRSIFEAKIPDACVKEWADQSVFQKSFVPDKIVSGTGAGDTAIAAFLYSLALGKSPKVCLENAAGTGSMNLTHYGSLSGLLPIEQLRERIDAGWATQDLIED